MFYIVVLVTIFFNERRQLLFCSSVTIQLPLLGSSWGRAKCDNNVGFYFNHQYVWACAQTEIIAFV